MTVRVPMMPTVFQLAARDLRPTTGMALSIGIGEIASSSRMQKFPPIE